MQVVFATAEPYGAYHLTPLVDEAEIRGIEAVHLLPYPTPSQGDAFPTSTDLGAVIDADLVVVTGGRLLPWTEAVAYAAHRWEIPVAFLELAYLADAVLGRQAPPLAAVLAGSELSSGLVSSHLGVPRTEIRVVGSPLLDNLPSYSPHSGRVLALTTVSETSPDRGSALLQACQALDAAGFEVVVRCHPREDRSIWESFTIDDSPDPATAAASAEAVVAYPGTAALPTAAVGAPLVFLGGEDWMLSKAPAHLWQLASVLEDPSAAPDAVRRATPAARGKVEAVTGPIGGAASRIFTALGEAVA